MSASQKKKLRKEQNAAALTEKQQQEIKDAKKLRLQTTAFTAVIALMLVVVIFTTVTSSGIIQRGTTALTVDGVEISAAELNHYYIDSVNNFYNNYGSYASLFGLDLTKALDDQVYDEESGDTWADYFLDSAIDSAKYMYAIYNAAMKDEEYTPSASITTQVESAASTMAIYAAYNGFSGADGYIAAVYGEGCNEDTYRKYCEIQLIASEYAAAHQASLTYTNDDLRAHEDKNYDAYTSYTYNYYYMGVSSFYQGGTKGEDGKITYSDEEKAAAVKAAEEAAKGLASLENSTVDMFNLSIGKLSINAEAETKPTSTRRENCLYNNVDAKLTEWVTDPSRVEGDMTYIANESTSKDEDGKETTTINGYYVVRYESKNENLTKLVNVRHILVAPEGGKYNSSTGTTTYTADEMSAAKEKADALLAEFLAGEVTEEAFAALAEKNTADPGSKTTGGLYENVYPGQMVTNFNDWCFDESRKPGDTGIVESDYGYHIMYFSGLSETTYRDFMIESDLRSNDMTEWEDSLYEAAKVEELNTKYVNKELVISSK